MTNYTVKKLKKELKSKNINTNQSNSSISTSKFLSKVKGKHSINEKIKLMLRENHYNKVYKTSMPICVELIRQKI